MKEKLIKVLHLVRLGVLFLGLIEKLARRLIKKLTAIADFAQDFLNRHTQVCDE